MWIGRYLGTLARLESGGALRAGGEWRTCGRGARPSRRKGRWRRRSSRRPTQSLTAPKLPACYLLTSFALCATTPEPPRQCQLWRWRQRGGQGRSRFPIRSSAIQTQHDIHSTTATFRSDGPTWKGTKRFWCDCSSFWFEEQHSNPRCPTYSPSSSESKTTCQADCGRHFLGVEQHCVGAQIVGQQIPKRFARKTFFTVKNSYHASARGTIGPFANPPCLMSWDPSCSHTSWRRTVKSGRLRVETIIQLLESNIWQAGCRLLVVSLGYTSSAMLSYLHFDVIKNNPNRTNCAGKLKLQGKRRE